MATILLNLKLFIREIFFEVSPFLFHAQCVAAPFSFSTSSFSSAKATASEIFIFIDNKCYVSYR